MKRILVLNFFPAFYPPQSGGELRYFNFYNELSKVYNITLLSPTYNHHKFEIVEFNKTFREYRIPKEDIHNKLHLDIDQKRLAPEVSALVCALSTKYPNNYHKYYLTLYKDADIIIHESPYMLNYDFFFGVDKKPRIYNSYNCESNLVRQMWKGNYAEEFISFIERLERRLAANADIIFTVSDEEKEKFSADFNINPDKIALAPNGIDPNDFRFFRKAISNKRKTALFIGSWHPPNIEAAEFIANTLTPMCPEIDFIIAGAVGDHIKGIKLRNVKLLGKVDNAVKQRLFETADIAINPMFSGAGTNLKTLEYLAAGLPLLSTNMGIRGLNLKDGVHFILAEKNNFADRLKRLAANPVEAEKLSSIGKQYIIQNYSWKNIVENAREQIEKMLTKTSFRKTIVVLNDFKVSRPYSGGEVRINKLYSRISSHVNVLLICFNNENIIERTNITEHFIEIAIPKTKEHLEEETRINSLYSVSATDVVNSYMVANNAMIVDAIKDLATFGDILILSHPYMAILTEYSKPIPIIYESLNAEFQLKEQMLLKHPKYQELMSQVYKIEKLACENSQFIVASSKDDYAPLLKVSEAAKDIFVIPNGVELLYDTLYDIKSIKDFFYGYPIIVFLGSAHKPNIDALRFIIDELAVKLKDFYFIVIGSVGDAVAKPSAKNVLLFGKLEEEYKNILLKIADVAINPMMEGSGSNLKVAEYFSNRLPVITTSMGARGYDITSGTEAIICDLANFTNCISQLMSNNELRSRLSEKGYEYCKKNLDWSYLGDAFYNIINQRILHQVDKKKALVITYRYTLPPLGGAEVYLSNVIKELSKTDKFTFDIVTTDIFEIFNKYHFATEFTFIGQQKIPVDKNIDVYRFKTDTILDEEKYINAKTLYQLWMAESINISEKFSDTYSFPLLMGGWHFPESINNGFQLWSSPDALIYAKGIKEIVIKAYTPERKTLSIYGDESLIHQQEINGLFSLTLNVKDVIALHLKTEPNYAPFDVRPLGVLLYSLQYKTSDKEGYIRLDYCYKDYLKENHIEEYIESLIQTARTRKGEIEGFFHTIRGPNSQDLEMFLNKAIKNYDIVLGHSIPFKTSLIAAKYAKKYNMPLVLLPHFHFDDEFYHWKEYYNAMICADAVIGFPEIAQKLFYNKIGVQSNLLPGGAVYENENDKIDSSEFLKSYKSRLPFFLILGRKSGSKKYQSIIEASRKSIKKDNKFNLVMIGRDEDKIHVSTSDVIYLGEQPREVVLGALKECIGLINMSESESFGMVILEAWMQKKPVIINKRCHAFAELVQDNVNGLLATEQNLHEKIEYILENEVHAEQMGLNGYNKVTVDYTWKSVASKFQDIFENLIKSRFRIEHFSYNKEKEEFIKHKKDIDDLFNIFKQAGIKELNTHINIIDIGSGLGMHAGFLSTIFNEVTGVDIIDYNHLYNGEFPRLLVEKYERNGFPIDVNKINFITSDAAALPFDNNFFDVCVSFDAFEHIEEPDKALSEIIRITKPGGYIYIKFDPIWTADTGNHFFHRVQEPWAHLMVTDEEFIQKMTLGGATQFEINEYKHALNRKRLNYYLKFFDKTIKGGKVKVLYHDKWSGVVNEQHMKHGNLRQLLSKGFSEEELLTRGLRYVLQINKT
ncbi:MAG: glycosyltransferase [Deltaproteobacteria bacterium]|nr:glycosyltransferase [Deltaproteobacteria bacterium]MCL5791426.1 glycosyltransferase [Deltaproteobacteria bacterium]